MFLFFSLYKLRKIAQYVNNYKLIYILNAGCRLKVALLLILKNRIKMK